MPAGILPPPPHFGFPHGVRMTDKIAANLGSYFKSAVFSRRSTVNFAEPISAKPNFHWISIEFPSGKLIDIRYTVGPTAPIAPIAPIRKSPVHSQQPAARYQFRLNFAKLISRKALISIEFPFGKQIELVCTIEPLHPLHPLQQLKNQQSATLHLHPIPLFPYSLIPLYPYSHIPLYPYTWQLFMFPWHSVTSPDTDMTPVFSHHTTLAS